MPPYRLQASITANLSLPYNLVVQDFPLSSMTQPGKHCELQSCKNVANNPNCLNMFLARAVKRYNRNIFKDCTFHIWFNEIMKNKMKYQLNHAILEHL